MKGFTFLLMPTFPAVACFAAMWSCLVEPSICHLKVVKYWAAKMSNIKLKWSMYSQCLLFLSGSVVVGLIVILFEHSKHPVLWCYKFVMTPSVVTEWKCNLLSVSMLWSLILSVFKKNWSKQSNFVRKLFYHCTPIVRCLRQDIWGNVLAIAIVSFFNFEIWKRLLISFLDTSEFLDSCINFSCAVYCWPWWIIFNHVNFWMNDHFITIWIKDVYASNNVICWNFCICNVYCS